MMSIEEMQSVDEAKDCKRAELIKDLKTQWFNYSPKKRVELIRTCPEIAEVILFLIEL